MDKDLQQQIFSRLDAIAAKLGVAANHFWPIIVKQQIIQAYVGMTLMVAGLLFILALLSVSYVGLKRDNEDLMMAPLVVGGIFSIFYIIGTLCSLGDVIGKLTNPEYYALHDLLRQIGN